jgi:hypothetical protein
VGNPAEENDRTGQTRCPTDDAGCQEPSVARTVAGPQVVTAQAPVSKLFKYHSRGSGAATSCLRVAPAALPNQRVSTARKIALPMPSPSKTKNIRY